MSRRVGVVASALAVGAGVLALSTGVSAAPAGQADCAHQSMPASLHFASPGSLVVGPLSLSGATDYAFADLAHARYTFLKSGAVVLRGHTVTIKIAQGQPRTTGFLYYGRESGSRDLRASRPSVTFTACGAHQKTGTAGGHPATWWSGGFVKPEEPTCLPLDIYVDHSRIARHVTLSFGAGHSCLPSKQAPGASTV